MPLWHKAHLMLWIYVLLWYYACVNWASGHNQTQTHHLNEVGIFYWNRHNKYQKKVVRLTQTKTFDQGVCWLIHLNNDFAAMAAFPEQVYFGLMPNVTKKCPCNKSTQYAESAVVSIFNNSLSPSQSFQQSVQIRKTTEESISMCRSCGYSFQWGHIGHGNSSTKGSNKK